jgi:hypothetical protein
MSFNPLETSEPNLYAPRLNALGRAAKAWLDVTSPLRKEAVPALQVSTGYPQLLVEQAIDAVFGELTEAHLTAYLESLAAGVLPTRQLTILHMTAGNVFTAWLHGAVISVLLGHKIWIKPSSQESVFPHLWRQSVVKEDAKLAHAIRIVPWTDALFSQVDVIVAYGTDETLATLKKKAGRKPFVGYGHKASAAILFKEALDSSLDAAIGDIQAFDLQGCLSPQVIYVEGNNEAYEKALIAKYPVGALPQFKSFKALGEVSDDLILLGRHLSCIGVAGAAEQQAQVQANFKDRPDVRVCPLGEMQRPPLTWRNGGIELGLFLLKCKP